MIEPKVLKDSEHGKEKKIRQQIDHVKLLKHKKLRKRPNLRFLASRNRQKRIGINQHKKNTHENT